MIRTTNSGMKTGQQSLSTNNTNLAPSPLSQSNAIHQYASMYRTHAMFNRYIFLPSTSPSIYKHCRENPQTESCGGLGASPCQPCIPLYTKKQKNKTTTKILKTPRLRKLLKRHGTKTKTRGEKRYRRIVVLHV